MKPLLRLLPYLKPHFWLILSSTLLAIPLSAVRFSPAPLVKHFVDDLLVSKDPKKLWQIPAFFIGVGLVNFVLRFLHAYNMRVVVARVNQRLKNDLFNHLTGLSVDYFSKHSTGTLVSRVGTDIQYIDGGFYAFATAIREPITFLFLLGYALSISWKLTLVIFIIFPPLVWIFSATRRNLKRYITKMADENAGLFSVLQESFTGIRIINIFRLEKYVRDKFQSRSETYTRFHLKMALLEEVAHPMIDLMNFAAIATLVYVGGSQVLSGEMTGGELLGFFTAFALMMNPLRQFNEVNIKFSAAAAACERVFELFDWRPTLLVPKEPKVLGEFKDSIRFENVRFAYPDAPDREVLKGVSFEIRKGQVIGLVGASGAGKSSLVNLLPRLFDVTSGRILVDGVDIRELDLESLRAQVGVVTQDVFLFNDSVRENIRSGKLSATETEIREAASRANAEAFIDKLPQKLDTVIGDRGMRLSGGERQRISIARAFLRSSSILILDEATSSLDNESEKLVQNALDQLMADRTSIVIAHRLSTVQNADQILVFKEGQIVEAGTHESLLQKNGDYSRFYRLGQTEKQE